MYVIFYLRVVITKYEVYIEPEYHNLFHERGAKGTGYLHICTIIRLSFPFCFFGRGKVSPQSSTHEFSTSVPPPLFSPFPLFPLSSLPPLFFAILRKKYLVFLIGQMGRKTAATFLFCCFLLGIAVRADGRAWVSGLVGVSFGS